MNQTIHIRFLHGTLCCLFLIGIQTLSISAQDDQKKRVETAIPTPEVVELKTKDGVLLKCIWYPSVKGKEASTVLLLHDWAGSRHDLTEYAERLQSEFGCAVLVPDLRGHGDSTYVDGLTVRLNFEKFKAAEIATIIMDIEACKSYLTKRNNEGELNIDLLTVLAIGKTCIHALEWSIKDWLYEPLGGVKMGKDVKGLVLIEPEKSFRGLTLNQTIKHPLYTGPADQSLSIMVFADSTKGDKAVRDSKSVYTSIERLRKENNQGQRFMYFFEFTTKQQRQVVERNDLDVPVPDMIGQFVQTVEQRFADTHRWQDRSRD